MQARGDSASQKFKPHIAQPIFLFLLAKLIAYTLLGFLLGALGSALQLTPWMQALVYLAVGVFMLGNGLRMLNVHPIFRYLVIEPPKWLTRFIRRKSKYGDSMVTPLFMGTLTLFLPCGVTQAMLAAALATGSAGQGAALMFAFILGTTPLFFSVSYFATRLGAAVEKYFTRIVAVTMLILGLVSFDAGLNLMGSPFSFSGFVAGLSAPTASGEISASGEYAVNVTEDGYSPVILHMPADRPVNLMWVTQDTQTCARSVVIPGLDYQKILPPTGRVELKIPAQPKGTILRYTCSMGMYPSQLVFDLD
ncbi:MAG: sulfite exporter TauE/SafE family protein [Saprospiraceae bacterium]|nr:sulfite exporter TauE/SafE family protein [Saprospiraceae bacterium]